MNSHLDEKQVADALLDLADGPVQTHLESCPMCQTEMETARAALAGFGREARREAERDETFWRRQGLAIVTKCAGGVKAPSRRAQRWAWGAVAATLAAMLLMWISWGTPDRHPVPRPVSPLIADGHERDELLLRQVEAALHRGAPVALEPAEVLTSELHRRSKPATNVNQVSSRRN